jgi:hypothetical protein
MKCVVSNGEDNDKPGRSQPSEVGYGKPPKETRFKPGTSGNPRGRPKGSRNRGSAGHIVERMKSIILDEAYRPIQIRDGERMTELTVFEAAMRSLGLNAAKGNPRSQAMFFELVSTTEAGKARERREAFEAIVEYQRDAMREVAKRRANGLSEDDILPHPDQIHICPLAGTVVTTGPWTKNEQERQRDLLSLKEDVSDRLREAQGKPRRRRNNASELACIASCEKIIARIDDELSNLTRWIVEGT